MFNKSKNYMKCLILAIMLCSVSLKSQIPDYIPQNGLVGWWPFNGNANDESGNGNNGTVNGASLTIDRNGKLNSAYSFDGDDYIRVAHNNIFNFGSGSYSLSVWFNKFNSGEFYQNLINKQILAPYNGWFLRIEDDFVNFQSGTYVDGTNIWASNGEVNSEPINFNQWYNVTSVLNVEEKRIRMYLDGILVHEVESSKTILNADNINDLMFGVYQPGGAPSGPEFYSGLMDDIAIWNRALTDEEIKNMFPKVNIPNYIPQNGLVGWWPFNGNANDESGNGNNGTVNGASLTIDRNGKLNSAYSFDQNEDIIEIVNTKIQEQSFSISLWAKWESQFDYTTVNMFKIGVKDNVTNGGIALRIDQNDLAYGNDKYLISGAVSNSNEIEVVSNFNNYYDFSEINKWNNYILVRGNGTFKLYFNGNLINTQLAFVNITYNNAILQIGNQQNLNNNDAGLRNIDDIAIWNRALTDAEIKNMYLPADTIPKDTFDINTLKVQKVYVGLTNSKLLKKSFVNFDYTKLSMGQTIATPVSNIHTDFINSTSYKNITLGFWGAVTPSALSIEKEEDFTDLHNYPNPFEKNTNISFSLNENSFIELKVYNIEGELIKSYPSQVFQKGTNTINFDSEEQGRLLPSGTYLYEIIVKPISGFSQNVHTKRNIMVLAK